MGAHPDSVTVFFFMATHKLFSDEHANELKVFRNDKNLCYINISNREYNHDESSFIVLDENDLRELIDELLLIEKNIVQNG